MIMAIAIVAMTSIIPLTTTPQIAKAETYCSQTYLTQQERYNCGYNRGYLEAQRDWNLNRGEDNSCPHMTEHTPEYCNGYQGLDSVHTGTIIDKTKKVTTLLVSKEIREDSKLLIYTFYR